MCVKALTFEITSEEKFGLVCFCFSGFFGGGCPEVDNLESTAFGVRFTYYIHLSFTM